MSETVTWAQALRRLTVPSADELTQPLGNGWLRCFSCGHACKIPPGRPGICQVRFNDAGTLRVPHGYVGALACDPIEKKPFFHALPGTEALSFGMLGCDLHCAYCFPADTMVATDQGPMTLERIFERCRTTLTRPDGEIGLDPRLGVASATGVMRRVRAAFRHHVQGPLLEIRIPYLPPLRCTPEHRLLAAGSPDASPRWVEAKQLQPGDWLTIPRLSPSQESVAIDSLELLELYRTTYRVPWRLTREQREEVLAASNAGLDSNSIGLRIGTSGSRIRHLRGKLRRELGTDERSAGPQLEGATSRFPKEHRPGFPRMVRLSPGVATLLGAFCAEGCVVRHKNRPNSWTLNFSFGPTEEDFATLVESLLRSELQLEPRRVVRDTTLALAVTKSSAALWFKALCGSRASRKRVPPPLFRAPRRVVEAFVAAVVRGDGHRYPSGKIGVTTVSRDFAWGLAQLCLGLGSLPSIDEQKMPDESSIRGRRVRTSEYQYSVVWYENASIEHRATVTPSAWLVPVGSVRRLDFEGYVYNLEVETEHNYLAGLIAVSNCQNWETSQAIRDPKALAPPRSISAHDLVQLARRRGASTVASTYNEPLITSEWAVEVFREAKKQGFRTAYISNGNGTPQVLEYLRPWVDLYKVDLKGFQDRSYRQLGGRLDRILDTIPRLVEMGFWVEIVTLVIPGFNDSAEELGEMARWLAGISPDIPWHVTGFHKDYKMTDPDDTPVQTLVRAWDIGRNAGLRYVYAGNRPGRVGDRENTRCPQCGALLIERFGFQVLGNRLRDGKCPDCATPIPGVWS